MAGPKDKAEKTEKPDPKTPPAPPRPIRLDVTSFGEEGKYTFDIQVISDQGRGIQADIRIIEGDRAKNTKPTSNNGFLEYSADPFEEEEQEFQFGVIGTDLRHEVVLDGPEPPKPKTKKKIKPIAGGFWANFRNVAKQYQKGKGN